MCVCVRVRVHMCKCAHSSVVSKKEALPFAKTWMNLEDVMLSEISHTEKGKNGMISFICGILKRKKS